MTATMDQLKNVNRSYKFHYVVQRNNINGTRNDHRLRPSVVMAKTKTKTIYIYIIFIRIPS